MEDKNVPVSDNLDIDINADSDVPGNMHLSNPDSEVMPETEKLAMELKEQKDKYLRLSAEFDNFKRRTAKEKIELIQTAGKEIISSLLEVLDDCERAEKQMQQSDNITLIKEGNLLVFNKLKNILQQKGLKPMQSIDHDFDVEKHEAVAELETDSKKKGKVIDEAVKGYYLNDKIIRFAKVVVGK
jgi:molecular chaperone GrpE